MHCVFVIPLFSPLFPDVIVLESIGKYWIADHELFRNKRKDGGGAALAQRWFMKQEAEGSHDLKRKRINKSK